MLSPRNLLKIIDCITAKKFFIIYLSCVVYKIKGDGLLR